MMLGSLSDTAISSMRPPMLAGPIDRKRKLASRGSLDWLMTRTGGAGAGTCDFNDGAIRAATTRANPKRTNKSERLRISGVPRGRRVGDAVQLFTGGPGKSGRVL